MKSIVSITLFIIDVYMVYIIYNDRNGEKYKCKKKIIDFVFLWLGILTTMIARIVTRTTVYIDWLDFVVSTSITVVMCWFIFLKDFYIDIKKLHTDVLPYHNEQIKQIRKTYIRNGLFLAFYIIQIIMLIQIFD